MTICETNTCITDIKIYVADLTAYNAGHLHGVWIDATLELDEMQEEISAMLAGSPVNDAEEYAFLKNNSEVPLGYAIHDYDGFEGCSVYEYEGLESVHEKALFIESHGELGVVVLAHFADNYEEAQMALDDNYRGVYESLADYARECLEDCFELPELVAQYMDYERFARDMELSGEIYTIKTAWNEIHIFTVY